MSKKQSLKSLSQNLLFTTIGLCFLSTSILGKDIKKLEMTVCSNYCETCYHQYDQCEKCGEKFYFHEFYKVCLLGEMPGCRIYASRVLCKVCSQGFKNVKGKCKRCKLNRCGKCEQSLNSCQQCRSGFTFSGSTASGSNCDKVCQVENCKKCFNSSSNFCEVCNDGFRKTPSDTCEACQMEGCSTCVASKEVCQQKCLPGYYWRGSKCEICKEGCKECSSTGLCLACDTNKDFYMNFERKCIKSLANYFLQAFGVLLTGVLLNIFFF